MTHPHARETTRIAAAVDLRAEVIFLARALRHNAELALIAADGEEPEHGAEYLIETLRDLGPRFVALRGKLRSL